MPPRRKRRLTPDLETNTPPNDARRDPQRAPPESAAGEEQGKKPRSRAEAMGVDEYERELDRLDAATSTRH